MPELPSRAGLKTCATRTKAGLKTCRAEYRAWRVYDAAQAFSPAHHEAPTALRVTRGNAQNTHLRFPRPNDRDLPDRVAARVPDARDHVVPQVEHLLPAEPRVLRDGVRVAVAPRLPDLRERLARHA